MARPAQESRKVPRGQVWRLCVHQRGGHGDTWCAEMSQSDKTEPNAGRTPCSRHLVPFLGSTGSPWITDELPWNVRKFGWHHPCPSPARAPLITGYRPGQKGETGFTLVLAFTFFPKDPTGLGLDLLMPRHWIHPPPSCHSLPLAFIFQNINCQLFLILSN